MDGRKKGNEGMGCFDENQTNEQNKEESWQVKIGCTNATTVTPNTALGIARKRLLFTWKAQKL